MTFDELWGQLSRKQPRLNTPDAVVEFTASNLERLLRQVYEQGQKSVPTPSDEGIDALAGIFGSGLFS